jgi:hypothetical protein
MRGLTVASLLVVLVALLSLAMPARAQQLLSGLTGGQCAARGGQITTRTSTAGRGPNVGDCYVAPRFSGGGGFSAGGGSGNVGAALSAIGAGLQFLDALGTLLDDIPSDSDAGGATSYEEPYDYKQTPEYQEELRARAAFDASMDRDTDDLKDFIRSSPKAKSPSEADRCNGYPATPAGMSDCYKATAAALERQAANCSGNCRATMLRAAASARCVAAVGPGPATVSATIAKCGKDPASGLQRVAAASTAGAPAAPSTAPAKPANTQQANAQSKAWVAPGSAAECQKLANSSIARNTAAYYDLCVSDPPSRSAAKTTKARAPRKSAAAAMPPPSPLSASGCGWYGGSLRPDGSCWVIGIITSDCLDDLHGRVAEDGGYKYCVMGSPAGNARPRLAAASPSSSPSPTAASTSPSDDALDACRDGAAAPWTIAGCYNLLGAPAAQNRPGALAAKLRESLERDTRATQASKQQQEERAEEAAVQARLYRDWRADAVRRYDRWVDEHHDFVPEDKRARDACRGRWTFDGTAPGSCDPEQSPARWELTFEPRQPPSDAEAVRVVSSGLPWRTNSETDCRNAGGIPVKPTAENDITGLPPQLLADPTVDQARLRQAYLCYQTLGRSH